MSDIKLGQLIDDNDQKRDALHMAVIPAQAYMHLKPGQRVNLDYYCKATPAPDGGGIGIVDPFLTNDVQPEEMFWVVMLPGTIKKLRHDWQAPGLPETDNYMDYDECRGCN